MFDKPPNPNLYPKNLEVPKEKISSDYVFEWNSANPEFGNLTEADVSELTNSERNFIIEIVYLFFNEVSPTSTRSGNMIKMYNAKFQNISHNLGKIIYREKSLQIVVALMTYSKKIENGMLESCFVPNDEKNYLQKILELSVLPDNDINKLFMPNTGEISWYYKRRIDLFYEYCNTLTGIEKLVSLDNTMKQNFLSWLSRCRHKEILGYYNTNYRKRIDDIQIIQKDLQTKKMQELRSNNNNEEDLDSVLFEKIKTMKSKLDYNNPSISKLSKTQIGVIRKETQRLVPINYPNPELVTLRSKVLQMVSNYNKYGNPINK